MTTKKTFSNVTPWTNVQYRNGAFPLEAYSIFSSYSEASAYANEVGEYSGLAYEGQLVAISSENGQQVYVLDASAPDGLKKLAEGNALYDYLPLSGGEVSGDVKILSGNYIQTNTPDSVYVYSAGNSFIQASETFSGNGVSYGSASIGSKGFIVLGVTSAENKVVLSTDGTPISDIIPESCYTSAWSIALDNYLDAQFSEISVVGNNYAIFKNPLKATAVTNGKSESYFKNLIKDDNALYCPTHPEIGNCIIPTFTSNHAEGGSTHATAQFAHAEGRYTFAEGRYSHAEGHGTLAAGTGAHAEGMFAKTLANLGAHAEGYDTIALGNYGSHAEGYQTSALSGASHAEGYLTEANNIGAHAEGGGNGAIGGTANGFGAHAEGQGTFANGNWSHAEGQQTSAIGDYSHSSGFKTHALSAAAYAEGYQTYSEGIASHTEGYQTSATQYRAHAEGQYTLASGPYSHSEGLSSSATNNGAHAEGQETIASGNASHAEGFKSQAIVEGAHAEGGGADVRGGIASGIGSHAEGRETNATAAWAHAEGCKSQATAEGAHAEGGGNGLIGGTATGYGSHAEGYNTLAQGNWSHAEGHSVSALGIASHASGIKANAELDYSFAWNGNSGQQYSSRGRGTFNINPVDELSGFYIGAKSLASYLSSKQDQLSSAQLYALDKSIKEYQTRFKVVTMAAYKKSGIYLAERDDTSKPIVIDWGDGTVEEVNGNVSQKVHEYATVGTFEVTISNVKTFAINTNNSAWNDIASQNTSTLKEVVLGSSVTSIVDRAFFSCSGLTSVVIPNSVTSIGSEAFYSCSGLTSVMIPVSVTSIGQYAFSCCSGLTSVTIPEGVTSIGEQAFVSCSGLMSVTIPNSVTSIESNAFYGCSNLAKIIFKNRQLSQIPSGSPWGAPSTTVIETWNDASQEWVNTQLSNKADVSATILTPNYANPPIFTKWTFDGTGGISEIKLQRDPLNNNIWCLTCVDDYSGEECKGYDDNGNSDEYATSLSFSNIKKIVDDETLPLYMTANRTSIIIGYTLGNQYDKQLQPKGDYALSSDLSSKQDKLSDTQISAIDSVVDERATYVEYKSGTISSFNIVGELNSSSIPDKQNAVEVKIGNSVTSIWNGAFNGCDGLTSVTIPDSVTDIRSSAFEDCGGLTSVTIPDSVTDIEEDAFHGCFGLTSITIPDSVTSIGDYAFQGCSGLTEIKVKGKNQSEVETMFANAGVSPSIITTWNAASQEWVKKQNYILSSDASKVFIKDPSVNELSDGAKSDLSVIKLTTEEYAQILSSHEGAQPNALYVISSDNINAYGQNIKNVAPAIDLSDAVNLEQLNNTIASSEVKSTIANALTAAGISADTELSDIQVEDVFKVIYNLKSLLI